MNNGSSFRITFANAFCVLCFDVQLGGHLCVQVVIPVVVESMFRRVQQLVLGRMRTKKARMRGRGLG